VNGGRKKNNQGTIKVENNLKRTARERRASRKSVLTYFDAKPYPLWDGKRGERSGGGTGWKKGFRIDGEPIEDIGGKKKKGTESGKSYHEAGEGKECGADTWIRSSGKSL